MAQSKKKWVAFKSNATVPADVVGEEEDRKMQVGEPVQLPESYANHVVQDGFAAFCDAPKKTAPKKSGGGQSAAEKAAAETAQKLAAAKQAVSDADLHLKSVAGTADEEEAREALAAAETELAALQPAS
ncbi:hypothetical protein ETW23_05935 [Leisingera sp. NJS201]|uniref:hypothetical protein n=1 Tax=Leisingera sp. NJS201 TaxID=2508306 RepID=UPI001070CF48|nr:hypothetical protein [Leisingera sp. NJS201]QBR35750.1 hypothetical protein ETW23_05935 [Leisingera sp. NJS201]